MSKEIMAVKQQVRLENLAAEVESRTSSGLTVQQWCRDNGISPKTYYYHLRRVRESNPIQGSGLAKAVQYAKNEKKYLYTFLENPNIPIDNNLAERTVKPFVIGRKNWLFSTSPKGAEASAMIYSIINTAEANGLNPKDYLTEVFTHPGRLVLPLKSE